MPILDISLPLSKTTPLYPGDPPFVMEMVHRLAAGAGSNNSELSMGSHNGTHIDAPLHFIDGAASVDQIPPEALIGPCRVVDCGQTDLLTRRVLEPLGLVGQERLLFRTKNSAWMSRRFEEKFVAFSADGAAYLAALGPVLIGIDAPSLDPRGTPGHPAHMAILGSGTIRGALEWVNLADVEPGKYELICAPLRVVGAEAAPCRVFLITPEPRP
jgi:arylformamidase